MAGMTTSLPGALTGAGTIFQTIGGFAAGSAAKRAGEAQQRAMQFQAAQLEQNAGQAQAASQRTAEEEKRKTRLLASRALALSASGGGGASDVTVQNIIAGIAGEGAYRGMVALYEGEEKARQLRMAAAGKLYEGELAKIGGKQQQTAYRLAAAGAGFRGATSLYAKYGQDGPTKTGSGDAALITDSFDTGGLA